MPYFRILRPIFTHTLLHFFTTKRGRGHTPIVVSSRQILFYVLVFRCKSWFRLARSTLDLSKKRAINPHYYALPYSPVCPGCNHDPDLGGRGKEDKGKVAEGGTRGVIDLVPTLDLEAERVGVPVALDVGGDAVVVP